MVEIWLSLARHHKHLNLVLSRQTFAALLARPDLGDLAAFANRLTLYELGSGRWPDIMRTLFKVTWCLPRGATVHYLQNAPPLISRLLGHRMIYSWVSNYCPSLGSTRVQNTIWLGAQAAFISAHRIDVLTPSVAKQLQRNFFIARRISITEGGTFADFNHFCPGTQKRDEVVFLARTEPKKNGLAFVQAIPLIAKRLAEAGRSARFLVYGAPASQDAEIARLLTTEVYRGIVVERSQTSDPGSILACAKVFVSLQVPSNYPSKSLVEAMGCGCVPVINESGDSSLMADDTLASYIPCYFTLEELAAAVVDILLMEEQSFAVRSSAIRKEAIARFRIERQVEYFAKLWELERD